MNFKRLILGTVFGAVFGLICVGGTLLLGATPAHLVYPYNILYLVGAFYNRVIMGLLIGLAGELKIYEDSDNLVNSIIRGAILGTIVTLGFYLFQQGVAITFLIAGIAYGAGIDLLITWLSKEK